VYWFLRRPQNRFQRKQVVGEGRMWLIRKKGAKVAAHIWTGTDTACRMYSTGGLRKNRYVVVNDKGNHEICYMCNIVWNKMQLRMKPVDLQM
jgi:hypothetical protein